MIIKATYFVYKDVEYDFFPEKRVREYEDNLSCYDTEAECFGYLCQKAWENRATDEDVETIELVCH